jgi:hypothetical protein
VLGTAPAYFGARWIDSRQRCTDWKRGEAKNVAAWYWVDDRIHERFNATRFRELYAGKQIAFLGDSLIRNQYQSLYGLLAGGRSSNLYSLDAGAGIKVTYTESHFLWQQEGVYPLDFPVSLELDAPVTKVAKMRPNVLVLSTGHWWGHSRTMKNLPQARLADVVAVALSQVLHEFAVESPNTTIIVVSVSPTHTPDQAKLDPTVPLESDTNVTNTPFFVSVNTGFKKAILNAKQWSPNYIDLVDITRMSLLRPDWHPGAHGTVVDMSHWCLPGVPDSWNTLTFLSNAFPL